MIGGVTSGDDEGGEEEKEVKECGWVEECEDMKH